MVEIQSSEAVKNNFTYIWCIQPNLLIRPILLLFLLITSVVTQLKAQAPTSLRTEILIAGGAISHRRLPHTLVERASVAPPYRTVS